MMSSSIIKADQDTLSNNGSTDFYRNTAMVSIIIGCIVIIALICTLPIIVYSTNSLRHDIADRVITFKVCMTYFNINHYSISESN